MQPWQYDEFKHCGVDYASEKQAEIYETRHRKFRDFQKEFDGMMTFLDVAHPETQTLIDLGCGTGAASILAARLFKTVYAVDVSEAMLAQARANAGPEPHNLVFVQGGFLSYTHEGEPADVVISKAAFHHLPDFWKQIALQRINRMLKADGVFYLHDVVFQFEPHEYADRINAWVGHLGELAGDSMRRDVETHIRNEYSTFDWILRGMMERAGFTVEKSRSSDGFMTEYACRKCRSLPPER